MATGETFKATIIAQGSDLTAYVFDYGYVDDGSGSVHLDMGVLAGDFQSLVQGKYSAALTDDVTLVRYRAACVHGIHAGEIGYVEGSGVVGELSATNRMPNELCCSMKRATGYASRRDRGRVFFGPLCTALIDNANINLIDLGSALLQDVMNLGSANLVSGGVTLKPAILAADGTYSGHKVVRVAMNPVLCHRKTRRPRVGS